MVLPLAMPRLSLQTRPSHTQKRKHVSAFTVAFHGHKQAQKAAFRTLPGLRHVFVLRGSCSPPTSSMLQSSLVLIVLLPVLHLYYRPSSWKMPAGCTLWRTVSNVQMTLGYMFFGHHMMCCSTAASICKVPRLCSRIQSALRLRRFRPPPADSEGAPSRG